VSPVMWVERVPEYSFTITAMNVLYRHARTWAAVEITHLRARSAFYHKRAAEEQNRSLRFRLDFAIGESVVHMLRIGARVREPFETLATLERFLAAVQTLVFLQVVLVFECLTTLLALVWP
jgi:hypothetical protein